MSCIESTFQSIKSSQTLAPKLQQLVRRYYPTNTILNQVPEALQSVLSTNFKRIMLGNPVGLTNTTSPEVAVAQRSFQTSLPRPMSNQMARTSAVVC
jgi:hypothetical protein